MNDFSLQTRRALAGKGIRVMSATVAYIGGISDTVYNIDDNGTHRVLPFMNVLALSK